MDFKGNQAVNWLYFKASWLSYTAATELAGKDAAIQLGTLLSIMGKECYFVYEHLPLSAAQRNDPDKILECLREHLSQRLTLYTRDSCSTPANRNRAR